MVNKNWNQTEFNNEYNKELIEIVFKNKDFKEEQLLIEDYSNLETLYLRGIDSLNKLTLQNLPKLQKCTISDCGMQELVIENCSRIKELKIDDNLLTNLEFLKNLPNLQKLNVDDNSELSSGLEYLSKGVKFSCDNTKLDYQEEENKELKKLQKENQDLKESKKNLKKAIKENVVDQLDQLDSKLGKITKKIERSSSFSQSGNTDELTSMASQVVKNIKEINENLKKELSDSETKLQEQVLLQQKKELELELQKAKAEDLKREWKEALKEGAKNDSASAEKEKWEQKTRDLEKELNNVEKTKHGLERELTAVKNEVEYLREQVNKPTYQTINAVIGSNNTLNSQTIYQIQINNQYLQAELDSLKQDYQALESKSDNSNPNQLKKSILFLAAQEILATKRKETIESLIAAYNQFSKSTNKYDKISTFKNYLNQINPLIGLIPIPGVSTATTVLNQGISFLTDFLKNKSFNKQSAKFEEFLIEDEKSLTLLQETYQLLNDSLTKSSQINSVISQILKLNTNDFKQHSVFSITNIQQKSELKEEEIKNAIVALNTHLKEFVQSLQLEITNYLPQLENSQQLQQELESLLNKLSGEENKLTGQEEIKVNDNQEILKLQTQISQQEQQLNELVNAIKLKLKNRSTFTSEKKYQQRNELFKQFLTNGFIDSALKKVVEDKKINLQEITNLQNSIKILQEQLNSLRLENQIVQKQNLIRTHH